MTDLVRQATNSVLMQKVIEDAIAAGQHETTNTVLAAAQVATNIILGQRARLVSAIDVTMRMLAELDATTTKQPELQALVQSAYSDMDDDARDAARMKLADLLKLHARVGSMQKLMDSLAKVQDMERVAFRLDAEGDKPPTAADLSDEELLRRLAQHGITAELPREPT
jgi:uncharacterized protein (DUF1778 family)